MRSEEADIDLSFVPKYRSLQEIMIDANLAAFGDVYVNFIYSLAESRRREMLSGEKVSNQVLAYALRKAGMRSFLPKRSDRHRQADAAEALIVYAWIRRVISISECVSLLSREKDDVKGFAVLLVTVKERLDL